MFLYFPVITSDVDVALLYIPQETNRFLLEWHIYGLYSMNTMFVYVKEWEREREKEKEREREGGEANKIQNESAVSNDYFLIQVASHNEILTDSSLMTKKKKIKPIYFSRLHIQTSLVPFPVIFVFLCNPRILFVSFSLCKI